MGSASLLSVLPGPFVVAPAAGRETSRVGAGGARVGPQREIAGPPARAARS